MREYLIHCICRVSQKKVWFLLPGVKFHKFFVQQSHFLFWGVNSFVNFFGGYGPLIFFIQRVYFLIPTEDGSNPLNILSLKKALKNLNWKKVLNLYNKSFRSFIYIYIWISYTWPNGLTKLATILLVNPCEPWGIGLKNYDFYNLDFFKI